MNTYQDPLYSGAMRETAPQPNIAMPQDVITSAIDDGMKTVARNAASLFSEAVRLDNVARKNRAVEKMDETNAFETSEFKRRLLLADGDEESLFEEDGRLRETAVRDIYDRINKSYEIIGTTILGDPDMQMELQHQAALKSSRLIDSMGDALRSAQREKAINSYENLYKIAVAEGNNAEAVNQINGAERDGLITHKDAMWERTKIARGLVAGIGRGSSASNPAPVMLNGKLYEGDSAILAMQKDGDEPSPTVDGKPQQQVFPSSNDGEQYINAIHQDHAQWMMDLLSGDMGAAREYMPDETIQTAQSNLDYSNDLQWLADPAGKWKCKAMPLAHPSLHAAAVQATKNGQITSDGAINAIVAIAHDLHSQNPTTTSNEILNAFKDSQFYTAIGDGDEEVGKERARALVDKVLNRAKNGTECMSDKSVGDMISMLAPRKPDYGVGTDWRTMEQCDPHLPSGEEWDKSDLKNGSKERDDWFRAFEIWRKYRDEYSLSLTDKKKKENGEVRTKDEKDGFEKHAGDFFAWFHKTKAPQLKKEYAEAVEQFYRAEIAKEGLNSPQSGSETRGNVMFQDSQMVKNVINGTALPTDFVQAQNEIQEAIDRRNSVDTRTNAYSLLRESKQAKASAEAEQKKEAKEAEKREKAEALREEKKQKMTLAVNRVKPRDGYVRWDGENSGIGSAPQCKIPKSMLSHMINDLGFDAETQTAFIKINGKPVQIVGTCQGDEIMMNSTAILKIQPKPKKGEKYKKHGSVQYSYEFKSPTR